MNQMLMRLLMSRPRTFAEMNSQMNQPAPQGQGRYEAQPRQTRPNAGPYDYTLQQQRKQGR
jgi:hypothetical protein